MIFFQKFNWCLSYIYWKYSTWLIFGNQGNTPVVLQAQTFTDRKKSRIILIFCDKHVQNVSIEFTALNKISTKVHNNKI